MITLLERVRAATGPDRELDHAMWLRFDESAQAKYEAGRIPLPWTWCLTSNVDDAISLATRLLPDCRFALYTNGGGKGPACLVMRGDEPVLADEHAATLPLAIVAATLSALDQAGS